MKGHGREEARHFVAGGFAVMPDMRAAVEDEDVVAEGDKVVARYAITGTQTGDLMGIPATGKQIKTTVAIDWAFVGIGPIGEEIVPLMTMGAASPVSDPRPVAARGTRPSSRTSSISPTRRGC